MTANQRSFLNRFRDSGYVPIRGHQTIYNPSFAAKPGDLSSLVRIRGNKIVGSLDANDNWCLGDKKMADFIRANFAEWPGRWLQRQYQSAQHTARCEALGIIERLPPGPRRIIKRVFNGGQWPPDQEDLYFNSDPERFDRHAGMRA